MIVEQAEQWPADLLVMGTHGRRGLRRLALGSDAEMVVRGARVPVLLVRGS
jgi:nucleotide-binding universal stress UspA family protein